MTQLKPSLHRKTVSPTQAGRQQRRQVSHQLLTNPDLALHEAESSTDDETPSDCCPDHRRPPVHQPSNDATSNKTPDFTLHDTLRAFMMFRIDIDSIHDALKAVAEDRKRLQAQLRKVDSWECSKCKDANRFLLMLLPCVSLYVITFCIALWKGR